MWYLWISIIFALIAYILAGIMEPDKILENLFIAIFLGIFWPIVLIMFIYTYWSE